MSSFTEEQHVKFFEAAGRIANLANCFRAKCGSIIVSSEGEVIGGGYNAPPFNDESQRQCLETFDVGIKPKSDKTCCVHAEWNAILDAFAGSGNKIVGSTLYFMRVDDKGKFTNAGEPYCTVCSRLALQAGVATFGLWEDGPRMISTDVYNTMSFEYHRLQPKMHSGTCC